MPIRPFINEIFPGQTQANTGVTVTDPASVFPDQGMDVPWAVNPLASWLGYQCWVEVSLDAGMALHKVLPQGNPNVDTLGSIAINDPRGDVVTAGINMSSQSQATDIIQRMATSEYRFVLRGTGMRIGYKIPIPKLLKVGNATPVPEGVQRAANLIVGGVAGIPLWFAYWELPYVVTSPLGSQAEAPVPYNLAAHQRPDAQLPLAILLPRSSKDDRATSQSTLRTVP